jgi:hypothetical protein
MNKKSSWRLVFAFILIFSSSGSAQTRKFSLADLPTFDNFATYVKNVESSMNPNLLGAKKSEIEKNIILSLKEDPNPFLSDLSIDVIKLTLKEPHGLLTIRRLDNLLVQATQDLAEMAAKEIVRHPKKLSNLAIQSLEKIKSMEVKRDTLAILVAYERRNENFNEIFEFFLNSTFRIPNSVSRGLVYPKSVLPHLWPGGVSPYQTSLTQLRGIIIEVLQGDPKVLSNEIRRMKIKGAAQIIPAFKPLYEQISKELEKRQKPKDSPPANPGA